MLHERPYQQPSVMSSMAHFSRAPSTSIQRSKFDLSHAHKTTFDAGYLIPIFCSEYYPGDTFHVKNTIFCRLATPLKPVMDNMYVDVHYFEVPCRLLWDNFFRFMGERINPDDDPDQFTVPQVVFDLPSTGGESLPNYFGLPPIGGSISVNALPFRAYWAIYDAWYRDQNLQDSLLPSTGDGPDNGTAYLALLRRNKRHDYFTSCLPWPQKGDAVNIPLGTLAPVRGIGAVSGAGFPSSSVSVTESDGSTVVYTSARGTEQAQPGLMVRGTTGQPEIFADLSVATTITINDLRVAVQVQKLLERDARGGTRYPELVLSHWDVTGDDNRSFRPVYLGGNTSRVTINPIAASATVGAVPQGDLAGVGTSVNTAGFTKSFTEHGYIIAIASVRADLTYQQGIDRMWTRRTRYDFPWPDLAHLGEQEVFNKEIFFSGTPATDDAVFGYQERYAEARYKKSLITGLFNSGVSAPLDVWHLAQDFAATPLLNSEFIEEDPPVDRIVAVPDEPHFLADIWFNCFVDRALPTYAIPGFGGL